ncbi:MAG TPA: hypothetical protein DEQ02_05385, partial [Ruminococcaceae bacterium]|nr:hypothetical protein [Oscillospiraceae bacterium]
SLIAMFFVFLLTFDKMRSIVADAAITNTEQVVGQTTTTLDNYVDNMLSISSGISTNIFRYTPDEMQAYLNTSQMLSPDIVSITLFDELGEVYKYSPQSIDIKQNITLGSQQWYDETEAETAEDIRFSTPHVQNLFQNYYPWVITNYYSTAVKWDNKIKYTVAIDMSFATIDEYCRNINIGQRGYVFVMGPDGRIIYHPQQQMLNAGMRAEEDWGFIKDKENGAYFYNEDIVMVISTLKNNWKLIGISYMQETRETMNEIIRYMAFAYVAVFFLILLFAAAIARYVSKPVNRIIKAMEIAQDNQFTTYVWEDGFVEVRRLSASYNNMTSRIRELMEQIRREQRELRKTEIRALQAQINPHFLYNTLDSILWMCEKGDNKGAVTMVSSLGKLFRISLSKGREMITVREEVAHAENYLQIQGVRYKDQFSYKIEAEERLLDYKTPKIVLQPFLENAIYHAFGHSS